MAEFKPEEWAREKDVIWAGYLNKGNVDHALVAQFWDNDEATAEEAAEFVLRSCRFAKSWFHLLEKALPIIECEAGMRDAVPGAPFNEREGYWVEMRELANEISAEIDKAYGRESRDVPNAETCPHGFGFVEYCPDCKGREDKQDG